MRDALPDTITGTATHRHPDVAPDQGASPSADLPISYEGYPLGPVVFGWSTTADDAADAPAELLMVTTSGEILVRTPMDDLEVAKELAAELWRRFHALAAGSSS